MRRRSMTVMTPSRARSCTSASRDRSALLGKTPFLHYYGDYSAPGLFLLCIAADLAWSGDLAFFRSQRDKVLATIDWMDRDGDCDHDGFYE